MLKLVVCKRTRAVKEKANSERVILMRQQGKKLEGELKVVPRLKTLMMMSCMAKGSLKPRSDRMLQLKLKWQHTFHSTSITDLGALIAEPGSP